MQKYSTRIYSSNSDVDDVLLQQ